MRKVPKISDQNRSHFQIQHVWKHGKLCKNVKNQNWRVLILANQMCPLDQENDKKGISNVFKKRSLVLIFNVFTSLPMFSNMLNLKMTTILIRNFGNLSQFGTSRIIQIFLYISLPNLWTKMLVPYTEDRNLIFGVSTPHPYRHLSNVYIY